MKRVFVMDVVMTLLVVTGIAGVGGTGVGGLVVSYYLGSSAGAAISLSLGLIFALSFCFRKRRQ